MVNYNFALIALEFLTLKKAIRAFNRQVVSTNTNSRPEKLQEVSTQYDVLEFCVIQFAKSMGLVLDLSQAIPFDTSKTKKAVNPTVFFSRTVPWLDSDLESKMMEIFAYESISEEVNNFFSTELITVLSRARTVLKHWSLI